VGDGGSAAGAGYRGLTARFPSDQLKQRGAEAAKHSALAPLTYTVQWRRDDARPLITEMREIIRSVIDFPAPRCLS
jgi:hypothetical protein